MLKLNPKNRALLLATVAVAALSGPAFAQSEQLTSTVTLVVQNNFTLAESEDLNYGTIVAVADTAGANTATFDINPDSTTAITNNNPAKFIMVTTAQTGATFDVSGAAPSTTLSVTLNNRVNLSCGACSGSPPVLTLTSVDTPSATVTTDGTGAVSFNVGGVITTVAGGNQYTDGTYTGSFDVTVAY